jgi:hypothetical protein
MGAVPAAVRAQVLPVLVRAQRWKPDPDIDAKGALKLAHRASIRIDVAQTGTEHLLIGLAAENDDIGTDTLRKYRIFAKAAGHQVTAHQDGENSSGPEAHPG